MGDMLSQAEIDALLNGTSLSGFSADVQENESDDLTVQEIDALGEIGNISMGTSATTLYTLLGHKVNITTPKVTITTWDEMSKDYPLPYVGVGVEYTNGLVGSNLLIMKENDVKIITDLMMGGDGSNTDCELSDLHLSAISEAMNQMVGSSATSMSSLFDKRIDISPPKAFMMHFNEGKSYMNQEGSEKIVKVAFSMIIGNLIDSEIMQLLPFKFAKNLVDNLIKASEPSPKVEKAPPAPKPDYGMQQESRSSQAPAPQMHNVQREEPNPYAAQHREPVDVHPAQFQQFDESKAASEKKNISLIMDVPLQVTVELGRTQRMIRDILEFSPGSIIELDKLAGEPVDILVNNKIIARGEVVVIDESFGVRITDIINPSKRL